MCNPMQILSKEEFQNMKNEQNKAIEAKCIRVNKIFSSTQMKVSVESSKKEPIVVQAKITNNDFSIFKGARNEVKQTGKKTFKHVVEKNRVFYY